MTWRNRQQLMSPTAVSFTQTHAHPLATASSTLRPRRPVRQTSSTRPSSIRPDPRTLLRRAHASPTCSSTRPACGAAQARAQELLAAWQRGGQGRLPTARPCARPPLQRAPAPRCRHTAAAAQRRAPAAHRAKHITLPLTGARRSASWWMARCVRMSRGAGKACACVRPVGQMDRMDRHVQVHAQGHACMHT